MQKRFEEHKKCGRQDGQYDDLDVNKKLIIALRDLSHTMRFLYEGKGSQKRVLILLNEFDNITQHELTERLGIRPGSASEVIAKLEAMEYIIRTISETDRRTMNIELTEKGREAAKEAAEQRRHRHEVMFSCLSEEEKKQLFSLLKKLNEDWNERYKVCKE